MENWKKYIDNKFIPKEQFTFTTEDISNTLTIKHIATGTSISFIWPSEDWKQINDIHYYNDKTKGWSGEYNGDISFNDENIKLVDNFLAPVFEMGWVSKDIFIFGRHWKSKVYFNLNMTGQPFHYYSSDLGCLSVILFPLFALIAFIFGRKEIVYVDPFKKYNN
ncbi:MAG: hypothetical protein V4511_15945 [Bacteroidota bacterium]